MEGYISLDNGKLHYLQMGSGKRLLLCFHGYGNSASLFHSFERYLGLEFTIISIDLPHHGESSWRPETLMHQRDLKVLLQYLLQEFRVEKCSLAGYSMGGRVCLKIAELMPEKVDQLLLIASDGLVFNPLYFLVTKTFFGKRLFRRFLREPSRYLHYLNWMRSRKWLDESRYKFAMHYLGSESDRSFLLRVWSDMSLIVPNMQRLKAAIEKQGMPVYIFMGSYDRVIPTKHALRFSKGLSSAKVYVLEKGHRLLDADCVPKMADCLIKGTC